jgi:hypothetical protein
MQKRFCRSRPVASCNRMRAAQTERGLLVQSMADCMRTTNRMGLAVLLVGLLSSGCATDHLVHLGQYKEAFEGYQAAYSYKGSLIVSYQANVSPDTGNEVKDMASRHSAQRWASISIEALSQCPPGGFTNGIPFTVHRAALPIDIPKNAQEVPLIRAPVDLQRWPPGVTPPDAVKVEVPIAIVLQSGGLYGQGAAVGIRVRRTDGVSVWISGGVPGVSGRDGWAYPVVIIGFPPVLAFDVVTFPIQAFLGLKEWIHSITG